MTDKWIVPDLNDASTLPKDGECVLVVKQKPDGSRFIDVETAHWYLKSSFVGMLSNFRWSLSAYETETEGIKITHWKHLPLPPDETERTE